MLKTTELLVCEIHFNDSDFKTIREDGHSTHKRTNEGKQLRQRSLKNDAVPSKWPMSQIMSVKYLQLPVQRPLLR